MKAVKNRPLTDASINDFSGGLNTLDSQQTMKSKFAPVLTNFIARPDGSLRLRYGTKWHWRLHYTADATGIVELASFNGSLLVFCDNGDVWRVREDTGSDTLIWSQAKAALLPGAPAGWSFMTYGVDGVDTTEYKGKLVCCNGIDKPILISETFTVTYLQDLATGSNVNTPVGRYCTTVNDYCIIGGIPASEGSIYISTAGASGTYVGDPAPNDGIELNLASRVPENSGVMVGLASFRNRLLVLFSQAIVVVELGTYSGAAHRPVVQDNIIKQSCQNFRCIVVTRNDTLIGGPNGWFAAYINQFNFIDTTSVSPLIEQSEAPPEFMVLNASEHYIMSQNLFYCFEDTLQKGAFSQRSSSWPMFGAVSSTTTGRVYAFGGVFDNRDVFVVGDERSPGNAYAADWIDYEANPSVEWQPLTGYTFYDYQFPGDIVHFSNIMYICKQTHTSGAFFGADLALGYWEEFKGFKIPFDWELPWVDIGQKTRKKHNKYLQLETEGDATFNVQAFIDNIYQNRDTLEYLPAIETQFRGGEALGFGGGQSVSVGDFYNDEQPFGGGRITSNARMFNFPFEFKKMKLRFFGSSDRSLRIDVVTLLYWLGTHMR